MGKAQSPADDDRVPPDWLQYARPTSWKSLRVDHFGASSSEFRVEMTDLVSISMVRAADCRIELREPLGRWRRLTANAGDISLIPLGYAAAIRWTGWIESISVTLDAEWLFGADEQLRRANQSLHHAETIHDPALSRLIERLYEHNLGGSQSGPLFAEALALRALGVAIVHASKPTAKALGAGGGADIQLALEFIHTYLEAPILVGDVARAAGWQGNLYSFMRQFKGACGLSTHQYILDARIDRAKSLLSQPHARIGDVYARCGFINLSHFSDTFRKRVGISPSAWHAQALA